MRRDFSGADFSNADLRGVCFLGATLKDANFHGAQLQDADFTGADLTGACLEGVRADRAGFGKANLSGVSAFEGVFEHATFIDAKLVSGDFRRANLRQARLCEAKLEHAEFSKAQFVGADLSEADVKKSGFRGADLRQARLRALKRFESADFVHADVRDVDFSGAYLLRRHIIDQNYLAEFRERSLLNRAVYWLWWVSSDCGRSALRWGFWTVAITLVFGAIYAQAGSAIDYGDHGTALSPYYFSVVTLTTLGYGDVLPSNTYGQWLVIAEVCVGYMMLGGLISLFASKMGRRGD